MLVLSKMSVQNLVCISPEVVTMIDIIFILKPFSDPLRCMDGGIVILDETTSIRMEILDHKTQINFVLG